MKKRTLRYLFLFMAALQFSACHNDDTDSGAEGVLTTQYVRDIFYDEVLAQADLNDPRGVAEVGFVVGESSMPEIETGNVYKAELPEQKRFTAYINGLEKNTRYYLRPYLYDKQGNVRYGMEIIFQTANVIVDYVTMGPAGFSEENHSAKTLAVTGHVTSLGGAPRLIEYGAYYWIKGSPETRMKQSVLIPDDESIGANKPFTVYLSGLQAETEYEIEVYARNLRREQYAEIIQAKTMAVTAPSVELTEVKNVTTTSAVVEGRIISLGNDPETAFGVYFGQNGTAPDSQIELDSKEEDENGGYRFIGLVRGLKANTPYYFQAYAKNDHSEVRSAVSEAYKTLPPSKPIITTAAVMQNQGIGSVTAELKGTVESDGGSALSEFGIEWGASPEALTKLPARNPYDELSGSYTVKLSDLTVNTTYYYRAYAVNELGENSGELLTFRTGLSGGLQWFYDTSSKRFYQGGSELFYFELEPLELTVVDLRTGNSRKATAYYLDRNLGALEAFPRISRDAEDEIVWSEKHVGYFYQWGLQTPALVYRIGAGPNPDDASLITKDVWGGNAAKMLTVGWNSSPAIPSDEVWPETANPCPEGYRIPDNSEWQATARAIAAQGSGNGNFNDVYAALRLGKGGYRQNNGTQGKASIVTIDGTPQNAAAIDIVSFLWSSTACKAAGSRRIEVSENIMPELPVPAEAPFNIDNTGSSDAYHFGISDPTFNFGEVGRSWMMDTEYLTFPPSQTAFSQSKYYDPWQYYGSSARKQGAGVPVRCVRIEYQ
jgi:hypothetical protein